ncbi:MAG TPA: M23 family metallopeptidase [Usitatibacter sp.]|nr:M23 family metallopeptidase [Usitatibacter sp.]
MTGSSVTEPALALENAGESRHFSLAGAFFAPPGRALTNARLALLLVLLSTLTVLSFATLIERMTAPSIAEIEPAPVVAAEVSEREPVAPPEPAPDALAGGKLLVPVRGIERTALRDNYSARRGPRTHNALDIMAPRGTPVLAAADGRVAKIYRHPLGGLSVYQYDSAESFAYYYAHMDAFAAGLLEGAVLKRGDVIGYVGTTGNASPSSPHLHFAMYRLGADRKWWRGTAVNPYTYLASPG